MTLNLIRHGNTVANEQHLYCGSTDLSLSPEGRAKLQGRVYPKGEIYLTSGMKRTDETMEILYPGVPYRADERLREMDFGCFEMKSYEQLKDDLAYQEWISGDNESNRCPGGESGAEALARAMNALEKICAPDINTVVVTHGGVIAGAMGLWFPGEGKNRYQWQPKPGEGYAITVSNKKPICYKQLDLE